MTATVIKLPDWHYAPYRRRWKQARHGIDSLSDRELAVIQMIASGIAMKDIASQLGVSIKTGFEYRLRAMRKLEVGNTVTLIHLLFARGILRNIYADEPNG